MICTRRATLALLFEKLNKSSAYQGINRSLVSYMYQRWRQRRLIFEFFAAAPNASRGSYDLPGVQVLVPDTWGAPGDVEGALGDVGDAAEDARDRKFLRI